MQSGGEMGRKRSRVLVEQFEPRRLLSSLSLVAPSGSNAVTFTGPDRSTLIYYESSNNYQLTARSADGTLTRLPIPADTHKFTFALGSVWFTPRGTGLPGEPIVARSDGTLAGTKSVAVDLPSEDVEKIFELNNQVFIDGYDFGQYTSESQRRLFAFDAKLNRFRRIDVDALAADIGISNVMPVAAGMVGGKRLFFIPKTRSLYELAFPKTGSPTFQRAIKLPNSTGDASGTIGWAFLDGQFYYTTGTRVGTGNPRATTTWRTDGTAAGTIKISGGVIRLDETYENAVTAGSKHYAMDGTSLLSFDRSATSFTKVATIENVSDTHLIAAGDRLYYAKENALYTMKPADGPASRSVLRPGEMFGVSDQPMLTDGKRLFIKVYKQDNTRPTLLITEGKSATERRVEMPPYEPEIAATSFNLEEVAGNDELLVSGNSNQGAGYYSIRTSSGDHAPMAVISGKPSLVEGGGLRLDASGSADADGDLLSYAWDLDNDGEFDDFTTMNAVSSVGWGLLKKLDVRDGPDTFRIRVRVSDLEHATVSEQAIVRLKDMPPALTVTQPKQVRAQTPTQLTLAFTDAGQDVVSSATIEWGDGKSDVVPVANGNAIAPHTYASAGTFTISIASTDEDGTRQSFSGKIEVVRQFSGPVLIGTVANDFWLGYDTLALKDGTFLRERANAAGGSEIAARLPDGSPERVIIRDRYVADWQVVGKGALLLASTGYGGGSYEYYWTNAGGKRTTKVADAIHSELPVLASEGAYFIGENSRLKLVDMSTLAISTARTAKREYPTASTSIVTYRNKAYFLGKTPKSGSELSLWRLDGAVAVQVRALPEIRSSAGLSVAGDRLMIGGAYYTLTGATGRDMLSDGTAEGTRIVTASGGSDDGTTYERAEDFDLGRFYSIENGANNELWSLGAKSATARKIATFARSDDQYIEFIQQAGQYVYFIADDGKRGEQLWRTDGTSAGTIALGVTVTDYYTESFETLGNGACFAGTRTGTTEPVGLWVTDGTQVGTVPVKAEGTEVANASSLTSARGGVAFTMIRGNGLDVWTISEGRNEAKRAASIDATPLTGGHITLAQAVQVDDIWYVVAHVYLGSRHRDYLWAVYPG